MTGNSAPHENINLARSLHQINMSLDKKGQIPLYVIKFIRLHAPPSSAELRMLVVWVITSSLEEEHGVNVTLCQCIDAAGQA